MIGRDMGKKNYETERQGQIEFFDNYRIDYSGDSSILMNYHIQTTVLGMVVHM